MPYVTHKERRALIYVATALAVTLISLATATGILTGGTACSASADTCAYALR